MAVSGISLMLGVPSKVTLRPAPPHTGIVFVRTDLPGRPTLRVEVSHHVAELSRCTGIQNAHISLQTVEHLLAALAGLGVDNVFVEVDAPEPPIGDGSAKPFVDAILAVGLVPQETKREYLTFTEPIYVESENRQVILLPAESFRVTFAFDRYERKGVDSQIETLEVTPETFVSEIAPARTFCFEDEVESLRAAGLGKGATSQNVLLIGEHGPRENTYRFEKELVRHKILDLIGDLYLTGRLPKAHVIAIRSQHALNLQLVQKIFEREQQRRHSWQLPMNAAEIEQILPHRYPFLLVDRVLEFEEDRRIVAIKNVSMNEEFFRGHFPGNPIMPGVLITEALAQAGGVLLLRRRDYIGKYAYFMTIESAKFRKPVVPGDQLRLEVEVLRLRSRTGKLRGVALVDGSLVAEAEFSFAVVDKENEAP